MKLYEKCDHGRLEEHPFGDLCPMNPGCDCLCPGGKEIVLRRACDCGHVFADHSKKCRACPKCICDNPKKTENLLVEVDGNE